MSNGATEFLGQAQAFDANLGSYVQSVVKSLVLADVAGKEANAGYYESLLVDPKGKPRANVEAEVEFDIGGQPLKLKISEPVFVLSDLTSFLPQTAEIDFEMNLDAQASDESSYSAQETGGGSGSAGWGPFKISVHMSATAAEKGSSTRKSDYRSKSSCKTVMGRNPAPEGVSRLNDLLTDLGDIAKAKAKQTARDTAQKAVTSGSGGSPAPASGGPSDQGGDDQ